MNFNTGIILLKFAMGSTLASTPWVQSAFRVAIAFGLGYSNPGAIYTASQKWSEAANQTDVVLARIATARIDVNKGWIADDKAAWDKVQTQYAKEVADMKSFCSTISTMLIALATAYMAFAAMAAAIAAFVVICAAAVALAAVTPVFPAVKGSAEAAVNGVAIVADGATKTLTGITAAAKALILAGTALYLTAKFTEPGGKDGSADFEKIKIDWKAPTYSPNPSENGWQIPKKELPEAPK